MRYTTFSPLIDLLPLLAAAFALPAMAETKPTSRRTQSCMTLQGHPAMWSDEMFADFQHIMELLQADGRIFLTPYEYYQRNAVSK